MFTRENASLTTRTKCNQTVLCVCFFFFNYKRRALIFRDRVFQFSGEEPYNPTSMKRNQNHSCEEFPPSTEGQWVRPNTWLTATQKIKSILTLSVRQKDFRIPCSRDFYFNRRDESCMTIPHRGNSNSSLSTNVSLIFVFSTRRLCHTNQWRTMSCTQNHNNFPP